MLNCIHDKILIDFEDLFIISQRTHIEGNNAHTLKMARRGMLFKIITNLICWPKYFISLISP